MRTDRPSSAPRARSGRGAGSARLSVLLAVLAVAALALASAGERTEPSAALALTGEHGAIEITDSKHGQAILSAENLSPGGVAKGKIRVRNSGDVAANVSLSAPVEGGAGPAGGELEDVLLLRVRRPQGGDRPATNVYRGGLVNLQDLDLGTWEPGDSRRYRFKVSFPDRGSGFRSTLDDNLFQASWTRVTFVWTASG